MKNLRQLLTLILGCFVAFIAVGQEIDDMYFNSKDRAKTNAVKIRADLGLTNNNSKTTEVNLPINPTDSYSARNINPEYASQLNTGDSPTVDDSYFPQDFQPKGVNQNLSNCNCSSGSYYNPYYGNSAFNNGYNGYNNGFGSPYGSFYPSYGGSPFYGGYGSGLSMSLGYGWGGFSPGFYGGMGYGYGGSYGSNFWNPYSNPWGGGYYNSYYPSQTIVINNGDGAGRKIAYTKRSSRSSNFNNYVDDTRSNSNGNVVGNNRSNVSSGRSRTATPEYYDRSWKRNQDTSPTRGYQSNFNSGANSTRSTFNSNTNTGSRSNTGYTAPSRNSFNSGGVSGGGSRSSGSSGSSSGGTKTRGRNN